MTDLESNWNIIKEFAENGNSNSLILYCDEKSEIGLDKILFYRFTIRCLMFREWANKSLNIIRILIVKVISIAEYLAKENPENVEYTNQLNALYYNMSANFAPCWNDGFIRDSTDYSLGLEYAIKSIELRDKLNAGHKPFYMSYWAKGIHQLFLNQTNLALETFQISYRHAIGYCIENNFDSSISENSCFELLLATGYLTLTEILLCKEESKEKFNEIMRIFEYQKTLEGDQKEDAIVGIDQLQVTLTLLQK